MSIPYRLALCASMAALCAATNLRAADGEPSIDDHDSHHEPLEEVVISGTPLRTSPLETAQPTTVLSGEDLRRNVAASLGETVSSQPGVTSTFFGPVASRPVIRGLGGYRVQMLQDGIGSMDASSVSDDHAVTIESGLAQQIEILRGPAALLYGSGGAGGVVNVVGRRLPETLPRDALGGTLEARGDSALGERTGVGSVEAAVGELVLRAQGYDRATDDVRIAGLALSDRLRAQLAAAGEDASSQRGRVANSASDSWGAGASAAWIGARGLADVAYDHYDSEYGLPAEETAFIRMKQDRFDFKGRLDLGDGPLESLTLRAAHNDYTHTEFEAPGVPGTQFFNEAWEARATLDQKLGGDAWRGTFGAQVAHADFAAVGEEAFVPPTVTRTLAAFVFEERDFGRFTIEGGARLDNQALDPAAGSGLSKYDADALNLSLGSLWHFTADDALALNLTRTQRQPQATELYADGFHAALGRVERGDASLAKETGYTLDAALRRNTGPLTWNVGAFYNRYDSFVFIAPTGALDAEEGVAVYAYQQRPADLYGFEGELGIPVAVARGDLAVKLMGDWLRGRLRDGGGNLPAITPWRTGVGLDYDLGPLHLGGDLTYHARQDDVAANELPTDAYTLLTADVSYRWTLAYGRLFAFLRGTNLLDEDARQHASPLKDILPLPGRGVRAGVRMEF